MFPDAFDPDDWANMTSMIDVPVYVAKGRGKYAGEGMARSSPTKNSLGPNWEPGTAVSQHPGSFLGAGSLGIYRAKQPPGRPSWESKPLPLYRVRTGQRSGSPGDAQLGLAVFATTAVCGRCLGVAEREGAWDTGWGPGS